jgi:predicted glutamine amidotransferase
MCQLLGMNANTPTDVMFSFTGWPRAPRSTRTASASPSSRAAARACSSTRSARVAGGEMVRRYPIRSDNVIAHIRKATQGRVALENTHPFVRELWGRYWVFAHNGNLRDFAPRLHGTSARWATPTANAPSAG